MCTFFTNPQGKRKFICNSAVYYKLGNIPSCWKFCLGRKNTFSDWVQVFPSYIGMGQNNGNSTDTLHFSLLLWCWTAWSSGQSSWLQIQRSGFDSQRYQILWEVMGLERGPLSLVSTIEELLERNSSCSGLENQDYGSKGYAVLTMWHPAIRKSWY
jgi:hypothetical protein